MNTTHHLTTSARHDYDPTRPDDRACKWVQTDEGLWTSACSDEPTVILYSGPKDNGYRYCPYCGRDIEEEAPKASAKETKMTPYEKINKTLTANFLRDLAALMLKHDVQIETENEYSGHYICSSSVVVSPRYTKGKEGFVDIDGIGSFLDAETCKAKEQELRDEIATACAV